MCAQGQIEIFVNQPYTLTLSRIMSVSQALIWDNVSADFEHHFADRSIDLIATAYKENFANAIHIVIESMASEKKSHLGFPTDVLISRFLYSGEIDSYLK